MIFRSHLFADYGSRVVTALAQVWGRAAPSILFESTALIYDLIKADT